MSKDKAISVSQYIEQLDSPVGNVRLKAVIAIGNTKAHDVLDRLINVAQTDNNDHIRMRAIYEIARWHLSESAMPLAQIATDETQSLGVRVEAVEALGATNPEVVLPYLYQLLEHSQPKIRSGAVIALHNLRNPDAIEHLQKRLDDQSEAYDGMTIAKEARQAIIYLSTVT
ncbi:MAG: HEAT repeat domain-containing protein [Chloroflexota bacterium]